MRLLKRLFAADTLPEEPIDTLNPEVRDQLETHLRQGARSLSAQTPARMHERIMERIEHDLETHAPMPARPTRRLAPLLGFGVALAAAVLALVLLRDDTQTPPPAEPTPVAELRRGMLELLQPVLEAPVEVDQSLEQEAQNLLEDSQRLLVIALPTSLSKTLKQD